MPSLVVLALFGVATTATAANDVDATLDGIYREQDIQRQLPITPPRERPSRGGGIPPVFGWLVLAGAVIGTIALAVWLTGVYQDTVPAIQRKRRAAKRLGHAFPDAGTQAPSDWLAAADELARQGRFAEAIHLLLLGVLDTLGAPDGRTSAAETAREIARTRAGPRQERLRTLVHASELVHFGGRAATRQQFENCRRDAVDIERAAGPAPA